MEDEEISCMLAGMFIGVLLGSAVFLLGDAYTTERMPKDFAEQFCEEQGMLLSDYHYGWNSDDEAWRFTWIDCIDYPIRKHTWERD